MAPKTRQYTLYILCLTLLAIFLPIIYTHIHMDQILYRQGRQALTANTYAKAASLFEQAQRAGLDSNELFQAMAHANMSLGRWSEAEAAYRQMIHLQPEDLELKMELANILFVREEFNLAMDQVQSILQHKPDWSQALFLKGKIHTARGDFEAAIQIYQKILGEKG